MSRSRKFPINKDGSDKLYKKYFNKRVRKTKNIANGKGYKKVGQSWDISDWCYYYRKGIDDEFREKLMRK